MARATPPSRLVQQFSKLKERLAEVEDTLDAIRSGSIDALVVHTPRGEQLFTLRGADQTYRALVEAMNEGAVTLNHGVIAFCNNHFARIARAPLEKVFGSPIASWVPSEEFRALLASLERGTRQRASIEASLFAADGTEVPVMLSVGRFSSDNQTSVSLVVTDITERKAAEQARRDLSRRIVEAQELERQRVARDLHDSVNQLLFSAKFRLNSAQPESAHSTRETLDQVRSLIDKAIGEVRLISHNLRPSELDDLGLGAALRSLAKGFQSRYGITTRCRCSLYRRLDSEIEMALYRIAQEALANVARHARATNAHLAINCSNGNVRLEVRDNGKGPPVGPAAQNVRGWGLKNMKERTGLLGGSFSIQRARDRGTIISVNIPLLHQNGCSTVNPI
ncbi:MAG TPA: histidine kinase [Candidatus Limnocylindrales bacterium]|nr:histidine kinase [Candidatus Limnocylindrales bacterium]